MHTCICWFVYSLFRCGRRSGRGHSSGGRRGRQALRRDQDARPRGRTGRLINKLYDSISIISYSSLMNNLLNNIYSILCIQGAAAIAAIGARLPMVGRGVAAIAARQELVSGGT